MVVWTYVDSDLFIEEAIRSKHLSHVNVMRLLGVGFSTRPYFIVLDYTPNGDLKTYLRLAQLTATAKRQPLHTTTITTSTNPSHPSSQSPVSVTSPAPKARVSYEHMLKVLNDVTNGFDYLAANNFVHRDISARCDVMRCLVSDCLFSGSCAPN
jgi:serine/threonine protein kinase